VHLVQIGLAVGPLLEDRLAADLELDQFEGHHAVRADAEHPVLVRIEDLHRVVEQMLRHADLRLPEVQHQTSCRP
jgi:hypothetical protein